MSHRAAAISLATALSVAGGIVVGVFSGVTWIANSISTAVAPVEAQTQQNTTDIAVIKADHQDIQWIKAALEANGIKPPQIFLTQPK